MVSGLVISGAGSAAAHAQSSEGARTETSIAASTVNEGQRTVATLEAHVYAPANGAPASGAVRFVERSRDGGMRELGSTALQADGTATLVTDNLLPGDFTVEALYVGDAAHAPSASNAATVHADATALPDFAVTANPTSLNLKAGTFGNSVISIAPLNGFSGFITLSCSGLPLSTTCTFVPSNVFVTAQGGVGTMTLQTTAPAGKAALETAGNHLSYAFVLPGIFGLIGLGAWRNRTLRNLSLVLLVGAMVAGLSSCSQRYGYLHHPPASSPGTPTGASTIMVEATSTNGSQVVSHFIPVTLTVTAQ